MNWWDRLAGWFGVTTRHSAEVASTRQLFAHMLGVVHEAVELQERRR